MCFPEVRVEAEESCGISRKNAELQRRISTETCQMWFLINPLQLKGSGDRTWNYRDICQYLLLKIN
jgi:hypothetical protein